jgi:hypothetical protein
MKLIMLGCNYMTYVYAMKNKIKIKWNKVIICFNFYLSGTGKEIFLMSDSIDFKTN